MKAPLVLLPLVPVSLALQLTLATPLVFQQEPPPRLGPPMQALMDLM